MLEERSPQTYDFRTIEKRWQDAWEREALYRANDDDPREKYYVLEMLPYPSGDLHVGHAKNYTCSATPIARMMRMLRLQRDCIRWDGMHSALPAENAAIERGIDPAAWTRPKYRQHETPVAG